MSIETIKLEFVEKAKDLLEIDPYISISDLLVKYKIIPPIRNPRPTPDIIEAHGYKHDGMGNILSKFGRPLKPTTNGRYKNMPERLQNEKYKVIALTIPGYGSLNKGVWRWSVQVHTIVFALHHRRWPLDGYHLDHIDDDRYNNHPDNLRECTPHENNYAVKGAEKIGTLTNFFN